MPSRLAWIDHDVKSRERTLRILSLFHQKESRDELGLGAIRDSFADQLFPGTSTIQTRLRYMLFIPWIYRLLEEREVPAKNFAAQAAERERNLVWPLLESDDQAGIFGKMAGKRLKRLPSSVYWAGLGAWGILQTDASQDRYHREIDETYRNRRLLAAAEKERKAKGEDLDYAAQNSILTWHPALPKAPEDFPAKANFALTREEAGFLLDCIRKNCHNSLLTHLAETGNAVRVAAPWAHPDFGSFLPEHQDLLAHARLFSEVMHGAALMYNFLLARLRKREDLEDLYRDSYEQWARELPLGEIRFWKLDELWKRVSVENHVIRPQTQTFVEAWIKLAGTSPRSLLSSTEAHRLIEERERRNKPPAQRRFTNPKALEQWGGASGVGRLVYRWPNVQVLLNDLYAGLGRSPSC